MRARFDENITVKNKCLEMSPQNRVKVPPYIHFFLSKCLMLSTVISR